MYLLDGASGDVLANWHPGFSVWAAPVPAGNAFFHPGTGLSAVVME